MEVLVARSAGFCMGVRRAIDIARQVARQEGRVVYTHGPLIHNPQELERLRGEGIMPVTEGADIPRAPVIVRAHGIPPEERRRLDEQAERVVDATCPNVAKIQETISEYGSRGYAVVIAGDADHPEVVGLRGHARGPAFVVARPGEVDDLPPLDRVLLVTQTTLDTRVFEEIRERVLARFPGAEALSTICRSTHRRQSETRELARRVDAMVVIGGRNSANTRRLVDICEGLGTPAYHVETARELPLGELARCRRMGVTAGASTPSWIIREVVEALSRLAGARQPRRGSPTGPSGAGRGGG